MGASHVGARFYALTLALPTLRPTNQACFDRRNPLMQVLLPIRIVDLCRLEHSHGTAAAALLAIPPIPPMLADASAAAVLAPVVLSPVLAHAAAAAVLAPAALPPVLADASAAAALLALSAPPPVRTDTAAAATRDGRPYEDKLLPLDELRVAVV